MVQFLYKADIVSLPCVPNSMKFYAILAVSHHRLTHLSLDNMTAI